MADGIYTVLKNRAASGQYALAEMTLKIDALWVEGKLTDAEKALDERLFVVEAAMLDVGELLAGLMAGGAS